MLFSPEYLPERFDFFLGDAWGMVGVFLRLQDGVLIKSSSRYEDSGPEPLGCNRCEPPEERWRQFWQEVEAIGVWNWQSEYENPFVLDGEMWSLELTFGGKRLETGGSNAYPGAPDGPGFPEDCAFGQFLSALRRLTRIEEFESGDDDDGSHPENENGGKD